MIRPLRILHVVGAMSPGGIQRVVLDLIRFAPSDGRHVAICEMSDVPGEWGGEAAALGVEVFQLPPGRRPFGFVRDFAERAHRDRFDVVHVHRSSSFGALPLVAASRAGVPVRIAHFHNVRPPGVRGLRGMAEPFLRTQILKRATDIIGVTEAVLDSHFGKKRNARPEFHVIPNGIDPSVYTTAHRKVERDRLGFTDRDFVIGNVARFSEAKNHRVMLEVAGSLCDDYPDVRFVFAGEGPLRPEIERLAGERFPPGRVLFPGWCEDVPRLLSAFDAFYFPSLWEGFGIALLEAQAAGLPCVVSDRPFAREVLAPEMLPMLVDPERADASVACLARLIDRPELRSAMSHVAKGHASSFDIRELVPKIEAIYRRRLGDL